MHFSFPSVPGGNAYSKTINKTTQTPKTTFEMHSHAGAMGTSKKLFYYLIDLEENISSARDEAYDEMQALSSL